MQHQISAPVQCSLEVQLGRLFYPIGCHDNWEVMIFAKGDAGTGKSTLCDFVKSMFPSGTIGVISATHEATFGLDSLSSKRLIMVPDMPENFDKLLDRSLWQSMVSGDQVSASRKFKRTPYTSKWQVPMIMASNYWLPYTDIAGSVSRRVLGYVFENHVEHRDTGLHKKLAVELIPVMIRSIFKYRETCEKYKSSDVWDIIPTEMKEIRDEVKQTSNKLANFLANGDKRYQITYKQGEQVSWEIFQAAYANHIKFNHPGETKTKIQDKQPLKDAHYKLLTKNMCKVCHGEARKEKCKQHYHTNNRTKKVFIVNMEIVHSSEYSASFDD